MKLNNAVYSMVYLSVMPAKYKHALYDYLRENPVSHIENIQGIDSLEEYQKDVCNYIKAHDRVAIPACHDVGKTFIMGKIVPWFMSMHPGGICITTAPTHRQVEKLLWGEIRKSVKNATYTMGGKLYDKKAEWFFKDDWYAIGFSPKKEASLDSDGEQVGSSFQGFHGKYVLIVIDEGPGVPKQVWDMAEGLTTSANVKIVSIGNPTTRNCEFFRVCNSNFWFTKKIDCFDSPNLRANGITDFDKLKKEVQICKSLPSLEMLNRLASYEIVQPYLLTLKWVVENAINWGMDHPLFLSKALAIFPKQDSHALFDLQSIIDAQSRSRPKAKPRGVYVGVDPARFGIDKTIITVFHDWLVTDRRPLIKMDTSFVANEVASILRSQPPDANNYVCNVDTIGVGAGVFDKLVEMQQKGIISKRWQLNEINFAAKPYFDEPGYEEPKALQRKAKQTYLNLKARIFRLLSTDLKENIILPDLQIYQEQLPTILYEFKNGKMKIESKDEYKSRTGLSSPDDSDSLAIANFGRYMPNRNAEIWTDIV